MTTVVNIQNLSHSYLPTRKQSEPRQALKNVSLQINEAEIFCLLGPNGSGKSTLFKILSTLITPSIGSVNILNYDLATQSDDVRRQIGVVFQHPSLDIKLTARENLLHQGHLYGLRGAKLSNRISEMLSRVGLTERTNDLIEHLSGGNQRRVELAKGLLHHPQLMILDEPSTGIDPGARHDFMNYLKELRDKNGITILLTTHILEEADACDRIAILDNGILVTLGTPQELKHEIGGDVITLTSTNPVKLSEEIKTRFGYSSTIIDNVVHFERSNGGEFIPELVHAFPNLIESVTLKKPSLEDVFIHKTGHRFWN
ncbi:MAG: ATP-binding cassette domain-containing protein [Ignavibacteriae bacterium]|nr:ATP-binding cassette domain-containing protein [Ignavibacteriota bacterium]